MGETYQSAYQEGLMAYNDGAEANENPYKMAGEAKAGWDDGWDYANFMTRTDA